MIVTSFQDILSVRQANFLVVSCLPRNRTSWNDVTMIARFLYLPEVKFPVILERIIDIETFAGLSGYCVDFIKRTPENVVAL